MLILRDIKDQINNGLMNVANEKGFKLLKSSSQFVKTIDGYEYIFYMIYTKWTNYFTLSTYAYIRCIEIEKLYSKLIGGNWKENWTLGNEICKIKNTPDGRKEINSDCVINVHDEKDVISAILRLNEYFLGVAMPFYEKYGNLKIIDKLFNEPPFDHIPVLVQRTLADQCMKGLIIAKFSQRKNYNELVSIFDRLIEIPENNSVRQEYELVKEYLTKFSSTLSGETSDDSPTSR